MKYPINDNIKLNKEYENSDNNVIYLSEESELYDDYYDNQIYAKPHNYKNNKRENDVKNEVQFYNLKEKIITGSKIINLIEEEDSLDN